MPFWWFDGLRFREKFLVDVVQVGGAQATVASPATWTYQVLIGEKEIAEEHDPLVEPTHYTRINANLGYTTATQGWAYYTLVESETEGEPPAPALVLADINETPTPVECEDA